MASPVTISTQNINGFARNQHYVKGLCDQFPNSIRALQEHWMKPPLKKHIGVNKLKQVHEDFDGWGTSAMRSSMQNDIRKGRSFGGTGFIWNKKYSLAVKPRLEYNNERVTVLELNDKDGKILLINAYMPYYDTSNLDSQTTLYNDTLAFIDSIMEMNSNCSFILLADLNCNIYNTRHPFSSSVRDLMQRRNLVSTFDSISTFDPLSSWSRVGRRKNMPDSHTLIDFILVSRRILTKVSNVRISDYSDNLSDHLPIEMDLLLDLDIFEKNRGSVRKSIIWKNVHGDVRSKYETVMECELDRISVPRVLHGNTICNSCNHLHDIESYYQSIVNAISIADSYLPRCTPSVQRDFWNNDLTRLKTESIDAFNLWKDCGKPSSGVIFDNKKAAHYRYKTYLRKCQREFDREKNDCLHDNLTNGNNVKFWQSWKSIHGSNRDNAVRINGFFKDDEIANCFADSFESVYHSNDPNCVSALKSQFDVLYSAYQHDHANDNISNFLLSWTDMLEIADKIKTGKATAGFVKYEHILYGSTKLLYHLHILYNTMIMHGYVPHEFLSGVITPLVKDTEGDTSSPSNYRGLTLGSVFASLFEVAVLLKIGHLLTTDHLQFGYRSKHSTNHALYVLRSCVDYFVDHGSNVMVAFLDCSKGFDKVDHHGIFIKLMNRSVPLCFLNVIMYWYLNMSSVVKWNNTFSRSFRVLTGVRQGGILSPRLFVIYIDDLLVALRKSGVGCHLIGYFVAAIMYADDLALIAPTRSALQKLLNICHNYGTEWCITYNPSKTMAMLFGKPVATGQLYLNDSPITFVSECKYLGVYVIAGRSFSTSAGKPLSSFRCSANTILNVLNRPSEPVMLKLLYTNCVPIMTYACEIRMHSSREMMDMDIALNDCIRKIFTFNRWESTRSLRNSFGYCSITEIFAKRQSSFISNIRLTDNPVLKDLMHWQIYC